MKFHRSLLQPVLNALAQHGIELMQSPETKGIKQTIEFLRDDPKLSVLKSIQAVKKQLKLPADSVTTYEDMPVLIYDASDFRFEMTFNDEAGVDEVEIEQIEIEPVSTKKSKSEEPAPRRGRNRAEESTKEKTSKRKVDDDDGEEYDLSMFDDGEPAPRRGRRNKEEEAPVSKRKTHKEEQEPAPRRGRRNKEEELEPTSSKSKSEKRKSEEPAPRRGRNRDEEDAKPQRSERKSKLEDVNVQVDSAFKAKSTGSKAPSKEVLLRVRENLLAELYLVERKLQEM